MLYSGIASNVSNCEESQITMRTHSGVLVDLEQHLGRPFSRAAYASAPDTWSMANLPRMGSLVTNDGMPDRC